MEAVTTVISGDLHARWDRSRELFRRIGMIECPTSDPADDLRQPGFRHIQLGDAVSLGYGVREAAFLRWLFEVVGIDEALLGNHELPAVWHHPNAVMFHGFYDRVEIRDERDQDAPRGTGSYWAEQYPWTVGRDRDAEALVRNRFSDGGYAVAASVGQWLITHAGLALKHERAHGLGGRSADEIADRLNDLCRSCLEGRRSSATLDSTSARNGGIMWLRFEHLLAEYEDGARDLPQIVGHSGYAGPQAYGDRLWNIDTPPSTDDDVGRSTTGGAAALVTRDDGASLSLHSVP
jgi:hypothetical protein